MAIHRFMNYRAYADALSSLRQNSPHLFERNSEVDIEAYRKGRFYFINMRHMK